MTERQKLNRFRQSASKIFDALAFKQIVQDLKVMKQLAKAQGGLDSVQLEYFKRLKEANIPGADGGREASLFSLERMEE